MIPKYTAGAFLERKSRGVVVSSWTCRVVLRTHFRAQPHTAQYQPERMHSQESAPRRHSHLWARGDWSALRCCNPSRLLARLAHEVRGCKNAKEAHPLDVNRERDADSQYGRIGGDDVVQRPTTQSHSPGCVDHVPSRVSPSLN